MGAINGLESGLSQAMNGGAVPMTIYQVLDQSLGKGFEIVGVCFQKADEAGWNFGSVLGWVIAGLVVAVGTVLVAMLGGAVIIVAKFSLAVMFALGPLFIVSLMFPATARFFDSWFSQVMNYVLTIVIMAIIMTFAMKAYDAFIAGADFGRRRQQPHVCSFANWRADGRSLLDHPASGRHGLRAGRWRLNGGNGHPSPHFASYGRPERRQGRRQYDQPHDHAP